jgi:hypothetical protein
MMQTMQHSEERTNAVMEDLFNQSLRDELEKINASLAKIQSLSR